MWGVDENMSLEVDSLVHPRVCSEYNGQSRRSIAGPGASVEPFGT